jgi:signal transduction histidine kinase
MIRTPMNAIIGMTSLAHGAVSGAGQFVCGTAPAARSLLIVLNDVLDFSKIEAGRLDVESISFALEDVLGPVLDVAGFGAAEKRLELLFDVAADVRAEYSGDPARIGQILLNLVSNSIKFTERGFV